MGTPQAVTDANAQIVWRWDSDPFGNGSPNEDPDGDMTNVTVNLRFPGQYFDVESGLSYNYFRDYDPSLGRYTTSDPIGLVGGMNTYAYVAGNPINWIDPLGLQYAEEWAVGGAATGVVVVGVGSLYVDAVTGGLNLIATPQELGAGAFTGGAIGYGLGSLVDWALNENSNDEQKGGDSCPVPDTVRDRITKGNTDIRTKPGTIDTANGDFDALNPGEVSAKGNGVRVGKLADGRTVIVRGSRDGRPTVEIQRGGRTQIEIRYGPK